MEGRDLTSTANGSIYAGRDLAGVAPRCIMPPTIDGGSRLILRYPGDYEMPAAAKEWFATARLKLDFEMERIRRRSGGLVLDLPPAPDRKPRGAVQCTVSGTRSHLVTAHAIDRMFFRANLETCEVQVQAKAKQLWAAGGGAQGWRTWCEEWLPYLHWFFRGGDEKLDIRNAHDRGWTVTGAEICGDFVGLSFSWRDASALIGFRHVGDDGRAVHDRGDSLGRWGSPYGGVETMMAGTRSGSAVSLCAYDKDREIEASKGGDGSTYDSLHRAHGWRGESRTRIEWRFSGQGLEFKDAAGHLVNLRDPWVLANGAHVAAAWSWACESHRLATPAKARRTRWKTDPRWVHVQDACSAWLRTRGEAWRQARLVAADTWNTREERATRDLLRAAHRVSALHGSALESDGIGAVARYAMLSDNQRRKEMDVYGQAYGKLQHAALGPEIDAAARDWPAALGKAVDVRDDYQSRPDRRVPFKPLSVV